MRRKHGKTGKSNRQDNTSKVSGDIIQIGDVGAGAVVAAGRSAFANLSVNDTTNLVIKHWREDMEARIETLAEISFSDKKDLKEQVGKIQDEVVKGKQADPMRLEKLISTLAIMAPDIFEIALTTLANPLAGIGLIIKKIGDRVKLENQAV